MKKSLVLLFATFVVVATAGRLPESEEKTGDLRLSLANFGPVLHRIVENFHKSKSELKNEDVYESEAMADNVPVPKDADESEEEFRQKPMNLNALIAKVESIEKLQQVSAAAADKEDEEDSNDVVVSYGLENPLKFNEVKTADESEDDDDDNDEGNDNKVPISFGIVEETIDLANEDDSDVQVSFGLAQPIAKKNIADDEDEDDEDNQSIIPRMDIKENKEIDEDEVQVSFGLAEPIDAEAIKNEDANDDDDDDDDEKEDDKEGKPKDIREKIMLEIINSVAKEIAKNYDLKL